MYIDKTVTKVQILVIASGSLIFFTDGAHFSWTSPYLPILTKTNSTDVVVLTEHQGNWLANILIIGTICGDIICALIMDKTGRKNLILFSTIPYFISWIMIALATTSIELFIARFIAGMADGITFSVFPVYVGEISSPKVRGFFGSLLVVIWMVGILVINVIGSYFSFRNSAFAMAGVPIVALLTFMWAPESPYYYLLKNKPEEAERSLSLLRKDSLLEEEFDRIFESANSFKNTKFIELFRNETHRKAFTIAAGLRIFEEYTGAVAFLLYTQQIFEQFGGFSSQTSAIIYSSIQITSTSISTVIIDRVGRKPLLIISLTGSCITLIIVGSFFYIKDKTYINLDGLSLLPLVTMCVFVFMNNLAMYSIPVLIVGELFSSDIKPYAATLTDIVFSIGCLTSVPLFVVLTDNFGIFAAFYFFASTSFLGVLFSIFLVPETRCKTLEQIQEDLKKQKFFSCRRSS